MKYFIISLIAILLCTPIWAQYTFPTQTLEVSSNPSFVAVDPAGYLTGGMIKLVIDNQWAEPENATLVLVPIDSSLKFDASRAPEVYADRPSNRLSVIAYDDRIIIFLNQSLLNMGSGQVLYIKNIIFDVLDLGTGSYKVTPGDIVGVMLALEHVTSATISSSICNVIRVSASSRSPRR